MEFESCSLPQLCSEETRPNFGFGSSEKDRCACALHFHIEGIMIRIAVSWLGLLVCLRRTVVGYKPLKPPLNLFEQEVAGIVAIMVRLAAISK